MKPPIILDTSVMVDIFVESRTRHREAKQIADYLIAQKISVRQPMHAIFELSCAIKNETMRGSGQVHRSITESNSLAIDPVPIDNAFISKYLDHSVPYLKAGDLIFVALAKGDNAILVTEDTTQYRVAKETGVETYNISEFLETFVNLTS